MKRMLTSSKCVILKLMKRVQVVTSGFVKSDPKKVSQFPILCQGKFD